MPEYYVRYEGTSVRCVVRAISPEEAINKWIQTIDWVPEDRSLAHADPLIFQNDVAKF
jgi:hypothetical protein